MIRCAGRDHSVVAEGHPRGSRRRKRKCQYRPRQLKGIEAIALTLEHSRMGVLDIQMPEKTRIEATPRDPSKSPDTCSLVPDAYDDEPVYTLELQARRQRLVLKSAPRLRLMRAVPEPLPPGSP